MNFILNKYLIQNFTLFKWLPKGLKTIQNERQNQNHEIIVEYSSDTYTHSLKYLLYSLHDNYYQSTRKSGVAYLMNCSKDIYVQLSPFRLKSPTAISLFDGHTRRVTGFYQSAILQYCWRSSSNLIDISSPSSHTRWIVPIKIFLFVYYFQWNETVKSWLINRRAYIQWIFRMKFLIVYYDESKEKAEW